MIFALNVHLLKKVGQSRPLFVNFSSFLVTISIQIEKKHRWCAWDSNPGPQDGRRRRNHGAMVATHLLFATFWRSRIVKLEMGKSY